MSDFMKRVLKKLQSYASRDLKRAYLEGILETEQRLVDAGLIDDVELCIIKSWLLDYRK